MYVPCHQYVVRRTGDQTQYEEAWNYFGLESQIPVIDFDTDDIFFVGLDESGSCAKEIKDIKMSSKKMSVYISYSGQGGNCTSDATSRTFVIKVEKNISKDVKDLIIVESNDVKVGQIRLNP